MNNYNPQIHHRRSIRLKGYDYSQAGLYFVTICCEDRKHQFGTIEINTMVLNEFGTLAYNEWAKLAQRFTNFELDVFQIMPNHMHGIIALVGMGFTPAHDDGVKNDVGAGFTPAHNVGAKIDVGGGFTPAPGQPQGLPKQVYGKPVNGAPARGAPTSVGDIIGAYKSLVANECLKIWKLKWTGVRAGVNTAPHMGKLWQRNYYEHIIRTEQSYQTISNYIINNPNKWKEDKFYKE